MCPSYTTLSADPKQLNNVIVSHTDVAGELHRMLTEFMRETEIPDRLLRPRLELRV